MANEESETSGVDSVAGESETQQLNLGYVPMPLIRAFRRLADQEGKTLSRWGIDLLEQAVVDEGTALKRYYDEMTLKAMKEKEEQERLVAQLRRKHDRPRGSAVSARTGRDVKAPKRVRKDAQTQGANMAEASTISGEPDSRIRKEAAFATRSEGT